MPKVVRMWFWSINQSRPKPSMRSMYSGWPGRLKAMTAGAPRAKSHRQLILKRAIRTAGTRIESHQRIRAEVSGVIS